MTDTLRLSQLLSADRYYSADSHELEMERLFRPAWHCIGLVDDIPAEGDYFTLEHLGHPLLVQNQGDRVAVFHNVCAHRNSLLAWQPRGHMARITCGYHGWQYDRDGVVCKIPGGEHFKPMKASEFRLDRVRVGTIGRLIFVALDNATPPLPEFLGPVMYERLGYTFSDAVRPVARWTVEHQCNWKVLIENTLESTDREYARGLPHFSRALGHRGGDAAVPADLAHDGREVRRLRESRAELRQHADALGRIAAATGRGIHLLPVPQLPVVDLRHQPVDQPPAPAGANVGDDVPRADHAAPRQRRRVDARARTAQAADRAGHSPRQEVRRGRSRHLQRGAARSQRGAVSRRTRAARRPCARVPAICGERDERQ
jgi:nitrite reductase/ring-hydroxylating ferredoxin subunit